MISDIARPGDVVLVVEDDADYRALLKQQLMSSGYEVLEAADGLEALDVLRTSAVTAVIVDLQMPRLDGHGLCRQLRADPRHAGVPVMILSGFDEPDDLNDLVELGAMRYLRKGAPGGVLLRTLRLLIESAAATPAVKGAHS